MGINAVLARLLRAIRTPNHWVTYDHCLINASVSPDMVIQWAFMVVIACLGLCFPSLPNLMSLELLARWVF